MAIFLADEPQGIGQLDVSSFVRFASSNVSVAVVDAARVQGMAPGGTTLQIEVAARALAPTGVLITVTDHTVAIRTLRVAVVTSIAVSALIPNTIPWQPLVGNVTAQVQLQQVLRREGDAAESIAGFDQINHIIHE